MGPWPSAPAPWSALASPESRALGALSGGGFPVVLPGEEWVFHARCAKRWIDDFSNKCSPGILIPRQMIAE
jgi:hypothetical protein